MRAAVFFCLLALSLALGSIALGLFVLVPQLEGSSLVDPNVARALAEPLALRSSALALLASALLAVLLPRALGAKREGSAALATAGLAAIDRFFVLPRAHRAWSRVDLVARRPLDHLAEAEGLGAVHGWMMLVALALLVAICVSICGRRLLHGPDPAAQDRS